MIFVMPLTTLSLKLSVTMLCWQLQTRLQVSGSRTIAAFITFNLAQRSHARASTLRAALGLSRERRCRRVDRAVGREQALRTGDNGELAGA